MMRRRRAKRRGGGLLGGGGGIQKRRRRGKRIIRRVLRFNVCAPFSLLGRFVHFVHDVFLFRCSCGICT